MRILTLTLGLSLALAVTFTASADAGELKPMGKLNKLAPAFKLRSMDGALVRLDEIAYPGKEKRWAKKQPVLLDFFRTDCSPCRRSMPELIALHQVYSGKGLKVILVALLEEDAGRAKLERYVSENKLPFTIVVDANEHFSKKYLGDKIQLPSSFLINKQGTIIREKRGAKGSMKDYFSGDIDSLFVAPPPTK